MAYQDETKKTTALSVWHFVMTAGLPKRETHVGIHSCGPGVPGAETRGVKHNLHW